VVVVCGCLLKSFHLGSSVVNHSRGANTFKLVVGQNLVVCCVMYEQDCNCEAG